VIASSRSEVQRPERRQAQMIVLSDLLPSSTPDRHALTGIDGNPDDPVTTALSTILTRRGGLWIGRPQVDAPTVRRVATHGLSLDATTVDGYHSHCESTLWPLYHDLVRPASHEVGWRNSFRQANQAFARAAADRASFGATVWVHDYHLHLVPALLRRLRPDLRIGFFLTTMFPPADLIRHTPMHTELLSGLLGADLVGFQSAQAAENFLRLRNDLLTAHGRPEPPAIQHDVEVGVYPTSVDTPAILALAREPTIQRRAADMRASLGDPDVVLLSVDPATAAAGIHRRLRGLHDLLSAGTLRDKDLAVVQVVTTTGAPDERAVVDDVALEVARINGRFATVGRTPVHFVRDTLTLEDRAAHYLAADVLLATPLREGATTTALEFAAMGNPTGAIVLSEFSGTAAVLPEAFLVNPYDDDHFGAGLVAAITSPPDERQRRMDVMRSYVTDYDTHAWARLFLIALHAGADLSDPRTDVRLLLRRHGQGHSGARPYPTRAGGHW
jgi:trehalose 6-phosphate synthase